MITGSDVLLTIAQIGLGFAGFGSLVSTFVDPKQGWQKMDVYRLRFLIGISLLAIFFSLLPFAFTASIANEQVIWQLSSALMAITTALAVIFGMRATRGVSQNQGSPFWSAIAVILSIGIVLSQTGNALGVGFGSNFGGYFIGLFIVIINAAIYFLRMLVTLGPTLNQDS